VGQWGARSTYADANNRVIVPNPFYGTLFNDQTNVNIFTDSTQISQAATTPLTVVDTFSTGFDTGATVGSYLPGGWMCAACCFAVICCLAANVLAVLSGVS
jgi:hypothetical protein